jgi:hypothetical protein
LDDVFTDVFGKSATRVLALLEHGNGNFALDGLLSAKCANPHPKKFVQLLMENLILYKPRNLL